MLLEGLSLMAVGMTTVFSFLMLLVIVLKISARVFQSLGHRWPDSAIAPTRSAQIPKTLGDIDVAVALSALEAHRRRNG